jgi:hypothetical protein
MQKFEVADPNQQFFDIDKDEDEYDPVRELQSQNLMEENNLPVL